MSLLLRMIYVLALSVFRERLPVVAARSSLRLRVLPNDLDVSLHMNNGRYQTICDLNRVDLFIRSGLAAVMIREKWTPLVTEHTMKYRRPLGPFQGYEVVMEVVGWDDRGFHMTHTFRSGDRTVAEGTSVGVVRGREGVVPPAEVLRRLGGPAGGPTG